MKSKKGSLFIPLLTFFAIIILSFAFTKVVLKYEKLDRNIDSLGKKQFDLIENFYNTGEKVLFYVDQSSLYAARKALIVLAEHAGFYSKLSPPCGEYEGYALWKSSASECYPDTDGLKSGLRQEFALWQNDFFARHSVLKNFQTNYDLEIKGSTDILGRAAKPIEFGERIPITIEKQPAPTPETPVSGFEPEATECGEKLLEIARQGLGHPYCLGAVQWPPACSAEGACKSIDCSSFTKWVFDKYASSSNDDSFKIGVRNAQWQANNVGKVVDGNPTILKSEWTARGGEGSISPDFSKLQPGDLIFFINTYCNPGNCPTGASHVGIYAGNGEFIHAGAPVQMARFVDNKFYDNLYIGAKRICDDATRKEPEKYANINELKNKLASLIAKHDGDVAVTLTSLQSGEIIDINGNNRHITASTIKIFVLLSVIKDIESGKYSLAEAEADMNSMMRQSDNKATARLVLKTGVESVNSLMQGLGMANSEFSSWGCYETACVDQGYRPDKNFFTSNDINKALVKLYNGEVFSDKKYTDLALDKMSHSQTDHNRIIPSGVPAGTAVAHKIGFIPPGEGGVYEGIDAHNDAGIVMLGDKSFTVVFLSQDNKNEAGYNAATNLGAAITKEAYNYFTK